MPKQPLPEILTEGLFEHPAVQAWLKVRSDSCEPDTLEVLQQRKYSSVYRIHEQDGTRVIAKKCRLTTARIEYLIYSELLPRAGVPALHCYGLLEEQEGDRCWLFLEDAAGARYSRQIAENRALAGRWLAEAHLITVPEDLRSCFPARELDYYLRLLHGSRAILLHQLDKNELPADDTAVFCRLIAHLDSLESLWGELEEICSLMPRSLVHGDFVDKNLRICDAATGPRLLVFDWEYAGWGVPAADLAQFIDRVASPDLSLYCSILRGKYSHLSLRDVQTVAACGNLLRMVDQLSWTTVGRVFVCSDSLVKTKAMVMLQFHECLLTEALSAFQRSYA